MCLISKSAIDFVRLVKYKGCSLWNHQRTIFLEQRSVLAKDQVSGKSRDDGFVGAVAAIHLHMHHKSHISKLLEAKQITIKGH